MRKGEQQKIFHKGSKAKVNAFITLTYPLNKIKFKISKSRTSNDFIDHLRSIKHYVKNNKIKRFIMITDNASFYVSRKTKQSVEEKPIAVDVKDIFQLSETLVLTELHLKSIIESNRWSNCSSNIAIPYYTKWIVKMWHFGVDTIDEYSGKEFEVTFEEGTSDLFRIYTKRMKDGKNRVRTERQEYPNQEYADSLVQKLFPDGRLIDIDKMKT